MKSYTLLCFFLALAMILCPLCSFQKAEDILSGEIFGGEYGQDYNDSPVSAAAVKIMSAESKNITEIPLREYLIGTIAAEMAPGCHEEAIKAQAIAAHTLLEYTKLHRPVENADITDSSKTHQGYLNKEAQKAKWGESYENNREKIGRCVDEVINYTVFCDGEVIMAAYHAISNGSTESASEVWGGSYPYLTSVPSPGDKLSPSYSSSLSVTKDDFKSIMEKQGAALSEAPEKWVGEIKNTAAGTVRTVTVGGKEFKGTEIREYFSLKSSSFTCVYKDGEFYFTVSGYGHGVGMSQYGADFMARQGADYREILKHYYPGTEII